MDDAAQNGEDVIVGFQPLLEFEVLVPEGMRKEVETNTVCSTVE